MAAKKAGRYFTVGETTYAPGEEVPSDVVELVDNTAVWESVDDEADQETPAPAKKKLPASAHASPMLASSPLASSFTMAATETPSSTRPQSARLRHTTAATNLRHEKTQEQENVSRPETPATKNTPFSSAANGAASKDSKNETPELTGSGNGMSGSLRHR